MIALFFILQIQSYLFSPGTLSSEHVETGVAFDKLGEIVYVSRHEGKWGARNNPPTKIYAFQKVDETWESLGISEFSDVKSSDSDYDLHIDNLRNEAFFISNRTYDGKKGQGLDIWKARKEGSKWVNFAPVAEVNSAGYEASPFIDVDGNLYFSSMREGGKGLGDIYFAKRLPDGEFESPSLVKELSTPYGEWNISILKNDFAVVEISGHPNGKSDYGDFFVSKRVDGKWQEFRHLNHINTTGSDLNVTLTPSGEEVVWISSLTRESSTTDIYRKNWLEFLAE